MKILIAVDGSAYTTKAVKYVISNLYLTLIHFSEPTRRTPIS